MAEEGSFAPGAPWGLDPLAPWWPAEVARTLPGVATRIGVADGVAAVGAEVAWRDAGGRAGWRVERCVLSRGARRLFDGALYVPEPAPGSGRAVRAGGTGSSAGSAHRD